MTEFLIALSSDRIISSKHCKYVAVLAKNDTPKLVYSGS